MNSSSALGLAKLDRQKPLPNLSELLSASPLPSGGSSQPPLKDILPPIAKLPKISPTPPAQQPRQQFIPIPPTGSLADKVARSMENSSDFAQIPVTTAPKEKKAPLPSPHTEPKPILPALPATTSTQGEPVLSPEMSYPIPSPFKPKEENLELPGDHSPAVLPAPQKIEPPKHPEQATASLETDEDLIEALLPLVESSLEKALYAPKTGLHTYLEPMLRSTVRRAIAEQMQSSHHFSQISMADRLTWRMKALFSSQTFDDIVFDRTHRYQVEEVFLMRYDTFSLISYASHDPSRHANAKKIRYDLSRLMADLKNSDGELHKSFRLPEKRTALVRQGRQGFLVAIVRGRTNALVRADLDYTLEQVEQRFEKRLRAEGHHFIHVLQPILESCLLIQSPAPPK